MLRSQAPRLHDVELQAFVQHAKQMQVTGGYVVLFTITFTWLDWIFELTKNGFQKMQYLAVFVAKKKLTAI